MRLPFIDAIALKAAMHSFLLSNTFGQMCHCGQDCFRHRTASSTYGRLGLRRARPSVQALDMRAGIVVNVTRADRRLLEAIVLDRSAPQKHVWRANIILATADGCGMAEIMRRSANRRRWYGNGSAVHGGGR